MPIVLSSAFPLNVVTTGDDRRPALLLISPLGTTTEFWEPMIEQLAEHNWVIRFDLRGHGKSTGAVDPYLTSDLAADAIAVLDALEVPRAHVFGASLGGLVAADLAAHYPDRVERLILAATGTQLGPDSWWRDTIARVGEFGVASILDRVDDVFFSEAWQLAVPERREAARAMLLSTPADAFLAGAHAILHADLKPFVELIRASTLVIVGEDDPVLRHHPADDLIKAIPDSEAVRVGGASHRVLLEQPNLLAAIVCEFLTDPDGR